MKIKKTIQKQNMGRKLLGMILLGAVLCNFCSCASKDNVKKGIDTTIMTAQTLPASTQIDVKDFEDGDIDRLFYSQMLNEDVIARITGLSYRENPDVKLSDLRYLRMLYKNAKGDTYIGEMIVNEKIATDVLTIFRELYRADYPIELMVLVDNFEADDERSMSANNTSAFNYRKIENTDILSNHALGLAVDINPLYNPYIYTKSDGTEVCSPAIGRHYADRTQDFAFKIDENDLAYRLFTEHGFTWGGSWSTSKDYQHFEKK